MGTTTPIYRIYRVVRDELTKPVWQEIDAGGKRNSGDEICIRIPNRPQSFVLVGIRAADRHDAAFGSTKGLTATESEIATALFCGARAGTIARRRKVSVETVRTQIKSVYAKYGVRSHAEFILALLRPK